MTMPHSDALKAYEAAAERANEEFDKDLGRNPEYPPLQEAETAALKVFMVDTPASTPTELAQKIKVYHDREMFMWVTGVEYLNAILSDCARMQGWPISHGMRERWMGWRALAVEFTSRKEMTQAEEDALSAKQTVAYLELAKADCTSPGDFILKHYVRMLTEYGSTNYGEARDDLTGNPWDVDVDCDNGEATFETADKHGCYADIDATDVGANLLAYGLPYFSAKEWLDRADAIGLRVDLIQQHDGRWMFGQCMDLEGEENRGNNERLRREQGRLRRIIAKDYGGEDRVRALCDEMRREWPQLVRPFPAEAMA